MKINLLQVMLLGIDCVNIERLLLAMGVCQKHIQFGNAKLLSSLRANNERLITISEVNTKDEYSLFCIKNLHEHIETENVLIFQYDGFILNPNAWRITDDDYDKFYQSFREKLADIDTRLGMLQDAEDNYYIAAKYLLDLTKRAYDLFVSSEVEERRQLIKLVLQNPTLEGKKVQFQLQKPFDTILNYNDNQLGLEDRNVNITSQFVRIFKVFEDFRLIGQLREEMNKVSIINSIHLQKPRL